MVALGDMAVVVEEWHVGPAACCCGLGAGEVVEERLACLGGPVCGSRRIEAFGEHRLKTAWAAAGALGGGIEKDTVTAGEVAHHLFD